MEVYIDEAWRGPIAGPVYLWFVSINETLWDFWFNDSKSLTYNKRQELYQKAKELSKNNKIFYSYISISNYYIDKNWISASMKKWLTEWLKKFTKENKIKNYEISSILFDWNTDFQASKELHTSINCIKQWDKKYYQISIASIIAKVLRDRYMEKIWKKYPEYWFENNKGYWTQKHIQAIQTYGPCPYHRKSFLTKIIH